MKIIIDRIENGIAVCELEDGSLKDIELSKLPAGTREGSIVEINGNDAVFLNSEEDEKRKKNFDRLNKLFSKNHLQ